MIFVARHAETDHGAARVVQLPESPLSALGRAQAGHLARRVSALGVRRILASDLARAMETAGIVAAPLGLPVETDALLRERNFGDLRGLPYAQIPANPYAPDYVPPNGESWPAFFERVALAWRRIVDVAAATHGHLLVVTHGLVCHALSQRHWHATTGAAPIEAWANTSLSEIEPLAPWKVVRMNCVEHLPKATGGAL